MTQIASTYPPPCLLTSPAASLPTCPLQAFLYPGPHTSLHALHIPFPHTHQYTLPPTCPPVSSPTRAPGWCWGCHWAQVQGKLLGTRAGWTGPVSGCCTAGPSPTRGGMAGPPAPRPSLWVTLSARLPECSSGTSAAENTASHVAKKHKNSSDLKMM